MNHNTFQTIRDFNSEKWKIKIISMKWYLGIKLHHKSIAIGSPVSIDSTSHCDTSLRVYDRQLQKW